VKRRAFLAGAAIVGVAAAGPQDAPPAPDETVPLGAFRLSRTGAVLSVTHDADPGRALWETDLDGDFLAAERSTADNRVSGVPDGSFEIVDRVSARWARPRIETMAAEGAGAAVRGRLVGASGEIGFGLRFEPIDGEQLRFVATVTEPTANRIVLRLATTPEEGFFGFGLQLTYFDQKGRLLPILVQEHGVGRGRPVITRLVDLLASRGGGTPVATECPAPQFITSRLRSMFLENEEYSTFDLRAAEQFDVKVWSGTMTGRILFGATPLDLVEVYTRTAGRMRALPDWVHQGVIAGVQGGTATVRQKLATLRQGDVPLAGLWIQDWTGVRRTEAGMQLWWDWQLDQGHYPDWQALVADLAASGARMLVYVNPFLSREPGHDALYREAVAQGYLVERQDGTPYLIRNTTFDAPLIDLSNPAARAWIKGVIRDRMIEGAGASGWMADFGEALMFDARLADGDPAVWHNRYPVEWARVNREAIEEAGRGADILFFDRSGFTRSPGAATLFWLGDQLQSWDAYDGIKTQVVGILSGGISGFSLVHGDCGGYVALALPVDGHEIALIARSPELLMRWMELSAFTPVFRTHEGLDPKVSAQFDTSPETLAHLARCGRIYRGLGAYRRALVAEAAAFGHPVVRHPFLHFPEDTSVRALRYEFLLGPDLLVAPVLDPGRGTVEVYFPEGSAWTDLWTGADAGAPGEWLAMPAPLGRTAAFVRKDGPAATTIRDGLRAEGLLDG
jgi:alpha-glucosidase